MPWIERSGSLCRMFQRSPSRQARRRSPGESCCGPLKGKSSKWSIYPRKPFDNKGKVIRLPRKKWWDTSFPGYIHPSVHIRGRNCNHNSPVEFSLSCSNARVGSTYSWPFISSTPTMCLEMSSSLCPATRAIDFAHSLYVLSGWVSSSQVPRSAFLAHEIIHKY